MVSLSRRICVHPAGALSAVDEPPRTAICATITSLAKTPAGTEIVTWSLAAEVLPVAMPRTAIDPPGPGVGVAVGTGVLVAVGAGVGVAVGVGVGDGVFEGVGVGVADALAGWSATKAPMLTVLVPCNAT